MVITAKMRKVLWARSGNRCVICRCELVMAASRDASASVIGDECHIVSKAPRGPRYASISNPDTYQNLLLLCKNHHKLVDDEPIEYSADRLRTIKANHERWVRDALKQSPKSHTSIWVEHSKNPKVLKKIEQGKELVAIIRGTHVFEFSHDDLETEEEVEIIGNFLQMIQDYGDMSDDLDIKGVIQLEFMISDAIRSIANDGWLVFGGRETRKLRNSEEASPWFVGKVSVIRKSSLKIKNLTELSQQRS